MRPLLASFAHAFAGLRTLLLSQRNARIHLSATVVVVAAGIYLRLFDFEWVMVIGAIALVWIAEALNTALEFLADEVTLEKRDRIRKAKDVAALGVLVAAAAAVLFGLVAFLPHIRGIR